MRMLCTYYYKSQLKLKLDNIIFFLNYRWVTNNDSFAPEDPCFFCDVCFRMLHYDTEGNKLGEFLAYPYVDPGTFN